jgi:hypothetical protein
VHPKRSARWYSNETDSFDEKLQLNPVPRIALLGDDVRRDYRIVYRLIDATSDIKAYIADPISEPSSDILESRTASDADRSFQIGGEADEKFTRERIIAEVPGSEVPGSATRREARRL